ncbi:MAG: hypothetical protein ACR2O2_07720 [Ruegeria sp.]
MRWLWTWVKRLVFLVLLLGVGLAAPVAYVETMCRGSGEPVPYATLVDAAHHRPETRTLMTYPEWHIVHAYEDYAQVISQNDPHDYGYLSSIGGFWSSLCSLTRTSSAHGEIDGGTKQMVYVIGASFTAELMLKAAYEETVGRVFAALRGQERAPLDNLSAGQAAAYAEFLQQVPWYKWRFREDTDDLRANATDALRDKERRAALGLEYRAKAAYADVIAQAVAQVGQDELTLRMVVTDTDRTGLASYDEVRVISDHPEGIEIETPRYRVLTHLMQQMAADGLNFVEIAGNDDILFTALSNDLSVPGAIHSSQRQGFGDYRHLIVVKVEYLAASLRGLDAAGLTLEHVHDY